MGQMIAGRFELVAPIARGGQGTVWLAEDRRTGRRCAAKVLGQADSASLLRFVPEQGVQVDHAHLASPYGWAAQDDEVAIAMPLVAGGSLEGALTDWGGLGEPLTAALLLQLLDGLAELHSSGWIHRDVKPANVLLAATGTSEPHLRLGDMGLAMRADDPRLTSLGHLHGTPGYVPPEAYADQAPAPAQDLFAAGVTALRMLDPGCRPQDAGELERVLAAVANVDLRDVLTGLVSDDSAARECAAAEAPRRLARLARPEPSRARPDDGPRLSETPHLPGGYLTASGEPFEVFDQLEGLGEEFGGEFDADTEDVPPVAETTVITAPDHVEASAPAGVPGAPGATGATGTVGAPGVPGNPGTAASRPVAPAAEASGADRSRLLAWALVGAGVLALIAALVLLLGGGGEGASSGTGTSASSSSGAAASPSPGTSSAEPTDGSGEPSSDGEEPSSSKEASTASSTGYPSPDAPATPRSAGRPALTSSVREGQDCIPAEHGTEVIGMDEQHRMCTWAEGEYSWTAVQD
ncbi:serine/threonine protein kinase [Micrococcus luteus]